MNTIIKAPKDTIKQGHEFLTFLETQKSLTEQIDAAWKEIQAQMEKHNITNIKGDWGYITLAERRNWHGENLSPRFYKKVLDTARLNSMHKLGDTIPAGASFTTSSYLSKRVK